MIDDLATILDRIEGESELRGVVLISRKPNNFLAGADIRLFEEFRSKQEVLATIRKGQALLNRLATLKKPVVAAIHGACMGGGLELALACHYRLASLHKSTKFALPEVKLGLLPGFGGTQRLPRLIGLRRGLELILSGKNVFPHPARKMGLVDALIHQQGLLTAAKRAVSELAEGRRKKRTRSKLTLSELLLERTPLANLIYSRAVETVQQQTRGHYPAPGKIIETVRTGMEKGFEAGLIAEATHFAELVFTPESKALIHLFFAKSAAEKSSYKGSARRVEVVGVLGAGFMGSGIAQVSAQSGFNVLLKDRSLDIAAQGKGNLYRELTRRIGKGMTRFERDQIVERVSLVEADVPLRGADLVIEVVPENLELKRQVLRDVEAVASPELVFASNTSALPIEMIAKDAMYPGRVLGMHYFSPVSKMPLLEIVTTEKTEDLALATALEVGLKQGKTVIVVNDAPGFYTTRVLSFMSFEAFQLIKEGADAKAIDQAMVDFGFPVGPITLADEVGLDVGAEITSFFKEAFEGRVVDEDTGNRLVEAGYKGRKSGRGFYKYKNGRKLKEIDTSIYRFFGGKDRKGFAEEEIQERLSMIMINEAVRCLQEGVLSSPRDGDVGAVFGLGFPPFLGGPFWHIDQLGARVVVGAMERLSQERGERFKPTMLLAEMAEKGSSFYPT
jgi:3-hydroxyacyl-CoA dehydrogenase/enoyl-CoA hydratase/3-hydroxybutyryl-CoA epimerase